MDHAADGLIVLGGAFVACGLIARVGVRIGLPTIPLFVIAGILLGPHTPGLDLVSHPEDLDLVARLGLVFLLFYLGLEFSLDQLTSGGQKLLLSAAIYLGLNIGGGIAFGLALGWGTAEALVIAGIVGISSSAIVTKLLVDTRRLGNVETRVILGIIVLEDIFLAVYLALLQPVLGGAATVWQAVAGISLGLGFLATLALLAKFGTRLVASLLDTKDEEIIVVLFVGFAILTAGAAESLGVSDAIGAFMVGAIMGTTAKADRLRDLTHPLRDAFGAIFFFHFGLTIEPGAVAQVSVEIAAAVVITIVLAMTAGLATGRIHGYDRLQAANVGLTVLTRGEFSLVLATLALAAGLDARLGAFAAGYVLVLAIVGPFAVSRSPRLAQLIPARLAPGAGVAATPPLDLEAGGSRLFELGTELLQIRVVPGSMLQGVSVAELRLPVGTTLGLLVRRGATSALEPATQLAIGDVLLVFTSPRQRLAAERRLRAVHRSGRLASWLGDSGT